MKILKNTIKIGAEKPFEVLHMSDTHLTFADDRDADDGKKETLAEERCKYFPKAMMNLRRAKRYADAHRLPILHTGDLIDFVSKDNLQLAAEFTSDCDVFMAAGNHEFSLYVGEAKEDAAYRSKSLKAVQAAFSNDIRFSSRVICGVNFVALDNSYYLIEREQLELLKKEAEKEFPIVLLVHTPLYTPELYKVSTAFHQGEGGIAYLMNVPEEKMAHYSAHRYEQQLADEATKEAYEFIMGCPHIRAVLAGHIHHDVEDELRPGVPQLITGTDNFRHIRFE